MASPNVHHGVDLEAQPPIDEGPPPRDTSVPRPLASALALAFQPLVSDPNERHNGDVPAPTADNTVVQRDENHGDPSDGLWSMYLTEAEKQDKEVTETWKGDTDGILVFTGLFSATVASFIIESYHNLSPDPGDTTNTLLTQISGQLFNISNGIPLTIVVAQSSQPFKPTASAVRVNVLWFLSLILSLSCALSATLMQQWARRYQELAQRRGATHRRGRMRAYIFDGITRFEMARAVATMPTLLHISVFLFFTGLVDFLFPVYATVAYATLGCIMVFALAYSILTVLPNIFLDCPYATPLSSYTWRISQFFVIVFLRTILGIRKSLSKIWFWADQRAPEYQKWRKTLEQQVKMRQQWFLQGIRKSVELSAYRADSTVVTSALEWTLSALDEDKEIEDFAARVPGFFDSRVVQDATMAVLPLMSHQPNTDSDPIFGSRLYDLFKTCIPEKSILDKKTRSNRLRVCMKCLWSFAKAYNQLGASQVLPSYFRDTLAGPEIIRRVRAEEDTGARVLGRCFEALIVNKLAASIDSRTVPITNAEFACLSTILDPEGGSVEFLLKQPGAVIISNMISFKFGEVSTLAADTIPPDVLNVVQQTLSALSKVLPAQESAELQLGPQNAITNASNVGFESALLSRLHDLLKTCTAEDSPLTEEVLTCYLRMCLKGLWYVVQALNKHGNSAPLLSYICIIFSSDPEMAKHIREQDDHSVRMIGHCVGALVVNELATDIHSRTVPVSDTELTCLSSILDIESHDVAYLLRHPGAVQFTNMIIFMMGHLYNSSWTPSTGSLDVLQQTFSILSRTLPAPYISQIWPDLTDTPVGHSDGTSSDPHERRRRVFGMYLKSLWHFVRAYIVLGNSTPLPSYFYIAFTHPVINRRILVGDDTSVDVLRRCVGALVVSKLATDINARTLPVNDEEMACLSSILGTDRRDATHLLFHPGAIQFMNMVFLAKKDNFAFPFRGTISGMTDVVQQTFSILSRALPTQLNEEMRLDLPIDTSIYFFTETSIPYAYAMQRRALCVSLEGLWHLTRAYIERGNSTPLPSYIYIAFTHSEITRHIRKKGDVAARVIRRCVGALIVNKLVTDISACALPVNDDNLVGLSSILDSELHDVRLCLTQPGVLGLVNLAPFVLGGPVGYLKGDDVPLNSDDILQETLGIISHALPVRVNAQLRQDQMVALSNLSDDEFERTIVSRLHGFLKTCIPGASESHPTGAIRTSFLRMCLKTLWHSGKAYHQGSDSLPSYFPLMLASPEITHHLQTEQDPVSRLTGCCFGALIASKLVDAFTSPVLLGGRVENAELACVSAILGTGHGEGSLSPRQLRVINFQKVVSLMSNEIDNLFTAEGTPAGILAIAQETLHGLANRLRYRGFGLKHAPTDHQALLPDIYREVQKAVRPNSGRHKGRMLKTLERLRQLSEKLLLTMGLPQDMEMQDLDR